MGFNNFGYGEIAKELGIIGASGACVSRLEEYGGVWSAFARRLGSLLPRQVPRVAASFDRVSPNGTSMSVERRTFLVGGHRGA
jgi:hypothetical protein